MSGVTIYEFDVLAADKSKSSDAADLHFVPKAVFDWLEQKAFSVAEAGEGQWLRLSQRRGVRVVQVTSFVGVIRAPNGYQIEVLPKVGEPMVQSGRESC